MVGGSPMKRPARSIITDLLCRQSGVLQSKFGLIKIWTTTVGLSDGGRCGVVVHASTIRCPIGFIDHPFSWHQSLQLLFYALFCFIAVWSSGHHVCTYRLSNPKSQRTNERMHTESQSRAVTNKSYSSGHQSVMLHWVCMDCDWIVGRMLTLIFGSGWTITTTTTSMWRDVSGKSGSRKNRNYQ